MKIPSLLLKKLYTQGSLKNAERGVQFALKNRLADAEVVSLGSLAINGRPLPLDRVRLALPDRRVVTPAQVDGGHPLPFPLRSVVTVENEAMDLPPGKHRIDIDFETRPFGRVKFTVEDAMVAAATPARASLAMSMTITLRKS